MKEKTRRAEYNARLQTVACWFAIVIVLAEFMWHRKKDYSKTYQIISLTNKTNVFAVTNNNILGI